MSAIFLPQSKPASERNSPGGWQAFRCKKMTLQQTGGAGLRRGQQGKSQLEVQAITKSMFANKAKILSLLDAA